MNRLVGQVAFSGIHRWVSPDTLLDEVPFQLEDIFQVSANVLKIIGLSPARTYFLNNPCLMNFRQVPSDFQCHFSAGIKVRAFLTQINEKRVLFPEFYFVFSCTSCDTWNALMLCLDSCSSSTGASWCRSVWIFHKGQSVHAYNMF